MPVRSSSATWNGNLVQGKGTMVVGKGWFEGPFTRASRFENGEGTNPEELLGAAHAGCYSMFLSAVLTKSGFPPNTIHTTAKVHIVDGPTINLIELDVEGDVPNCDQATFLSHAEQAKAGCPVSKALASVEIKLHAKLKHHPA
ncbi:MAG: OsmC family protein [Anaerolineae bacterium]